MHYFVSFFLNRMGYVPKRHALLPPFNVALVKHSRVVSCYKRATAECAESFQT